MSLSKANTILKQYFGYDSFRPMQSEIIENVLEGKDTIVLMPTGGGKSVCYQIPAMLMDGLCVVVSPLISLMQDQVEALKRNGIPAAFSNSTQSFDEQQKVENLCVQGEIKLLYVSPEKVLTESFIKFLEYVPISLIAIDEAHCISAWGHDFRPEYTQLNAIKKMFPEKPVIALTATADKLTRKDIAKQLGLHSPEVFLASFDRKNISLNVTEGINRIKKIIQYLRSKPGYSGIIYGLSRKTVEGVAEKLKAEGFNAAYYHAGMPAAKRQKVQSDFLKDDIQIICATVAFGMGIDKPNVRFVIHYNLPQNVEGYYQEIGRGGRDGLRSDALLFYTFQDMITWRTIISDNENEELQKLRIAKLDRMQQFAEATICRRRILLSYFSETLEKDCGNCDVCRSPRKKFEATMLAQKALSACIRLKERVGLTTLVEVLRGSKNQQILEKGYHQIKTFGTGKDISFQDWRNYILQMLNLGIFEIAYDENNALKVGAVHQEILFEGKKVELVRVEEQSSAKTKYEKPKAKGEVLSEELFEALRVLRKKLADEQNVPPYVIFNDATLYDMAKKRPSKNEEFLDVSGVGQRKLERYGDLFLKEILRISILQHQQGATIRGVTYLITYQLFQQGLSPEMIVEKRAETEKNKLSVETIHQHLIKLYEKGYAIDLHQYIKAEELETICKALKKQREIGLKDLYEYFGERYSYFKIKIAMLLYNKINVSK